MRTLLAATAAPLALCAADAGAQSGVPPTPDTIVVEGERLGGLVSEGPTKTGTPLAEVPQAISIVEQALIDDLNLRTVAEALNYASGVRSQAFGSDTRLAYYQLRGFPQQNLFKDGLIQTNGSVFLSWTTPAEGLARAEVLKGPSSVLYGGASAGGLVNLVTKTPTGDAITVLEGGADEFGSAYASVDLGRRVSDTLAVRGVGLVRRGETQVDLADDDRSYAMGAAVWTPREGTEVTLRGSWTADRSNRPTGFLPYEGTVTPLPDGRRIPLDLFVSDPRADVFDRDQLEAGVQVRQRLDDGLTFVSNTRYGEIDLVYAGLFGSFFGNPVIEDETGRVLLSRGNSSLDADLSTLTTDNRFQAEGVTGPLRHTVLAGIDYARTKTRSRQSIGAGPPLDVFDPSYTDPLGALLTLPPNAQAVTQTGFYLQDQVEAGRWRGVLAMRRDRIESDDQRAGRTAADETTGRLGLLYAHPSGLSPFVSVSTSFAPVLGREDATGLPYRPETGSGAEIGLRYAPERLPISVTASVFDIERDGVLTPAPQEGFPRNRSQSGRQRSRGGEVEVRAVLLDGLTMTGALTAFAIETREGEPGLIGLDLAATPEVIASAYADYRLPDDGPLAGLGLGLGVRHTGVSFADPANTRRVPSATVMDATARYTLGPFEAALAVSNVGDERYVAACASPGTCYVGNFRRATFSLTYSR